jgi:hypothetical protein
MNRNNRHTRDRTDDRPTRTDAESPRADDPITDDPTTADPRTDGSTMREVNHVHPFADRGALNRVFERGTRVVADGGERGAGEPDDADRREHDARNPEENDDEEPGANAEGDAGSVRMKDIDHTPPHGEDVSRVFERGGTEEPVESEE